MEQIMPGKAPRDAQRVKLSSVTTRSWTSLSAGSNNGRLAGGAQSSKKTTPTAIKQLKTTLLTYLHLFGKDTTFSSFFSFQ